MPDIYTPIEELREELRRRSSDKKLRREVEDFVGGDMLRLFGKRPKAVLSQYVITPGHNVFSFFELAKKVNLEPLLLEYPDDKLVAKNLEKYLLGLLYFSDTRQLTSFANVPRIKIIDYNSEEGKKIKVSKTLWGEGLLEFHHQLFNAVFPGNLNIIHDFSGWFKATRHLTEYYYLYFLSLFICHGVLFENIEIDGREEDFSKTKILPSFYKLTEHFGLKPLIHPLIPLDTYEDLYWWCYPEAALEVALTHIKQTNAFDIKVSGLSSNTKKVD